MPHELFLKKTDSTAGQQPVKYGQRQYFFSVSAPPGRPAIKNRFSHKEERLVARRRTRNKNTVSAVGVIPTCLSLVTSEVASYRASEGAGGGRDPRLGGWGRVAARTLAP